MSFKYNAMYIYGVCGKCHTCAMPLIVVVMWLSMETIFIRLQTCLESVILIANWQFTIRFGKIVQYRVLIFVYILYAQ